MIKPKKISGVRGEKGSQEKNDIVKRTKKNISPNNPKPYPVPEEDSFIPPDDDSAEVKYINKGKKS
jgi:hypothetical protein